MKNETVIKPDTSETDKDPSYCNLISKTECANNYNCALINNICRHFTGCSAYEIKKDEDC